LERSNEIRNVILINDPATFSIFTHAMGAKDLQDAFVISPWNWRELVEQGRKFFSAEPQRFAQEVLPILAAAQEDNRLWLRISVEESVNELLAEWGYPPAARAIFAVIRREVPYRDFAATKTRLRPVPTSNLSLGWLSELVLIEEEFEH